MPFERSGGTLSSPTGESSTFSTRSCEIYYRRGEVCSAHIGDRVGIVDEPAASRVYGAPPAIIGLLRVAPERFCCGARAFLRRRLAAEVTLRVEKAVAESATGSHKQERAWVELLGAAHSVSAPRS